jgi:hypothetical protein
MLEPRITCACSNKYAYVEKDGQVCYQQHNSITVNGPQCSFGADP